MNEVLTAEREHAEIPSPAVAPDGLEVPRVLGQLEGAQPGPTLILVGGVHGNEPAGVLALRRVFAAFDGAARGLDQGRAVALAGNLKALACKRRYLESDLNRHWIPEQVLRLSQSQEPLTGEDAELRELSQEIDRVRLAANGPLYCLDLHTTSGYKLPFANLDDTLPNRRLAFAFPVPVVLGLEEELIGTLSTYLGTLGMITTGFESGQHDDPDSIERAEAAIWIAFEACGLVRRGSRPEVAAARARLARETREVPHVVEVRHRHAIEPEDWFRMDPGYVNFQEVHEGQAIAVDRRGPVTVPFTSRILMPLYQKQGNDGFFLVQGVHPFWLKLSAALRRLRLERTLHLLPGVERHPELPGAFVVDLHTARWLARQLFHLLGFRRQGKGDGRYLVMKRRSDDLAPTAIDSSRATG